MVYGTKGTMQVDYEDRIDFTRMREYREGRIQKLLEKSDFSCLILFATENKRYATSTAVASPEVDNMGRYAIVPRGGKPYIFGFGSEVANERINCSRKSLFPGSLFSSSMASVEICSTSFFAFSRPSRVT